MLKRLPERRAQARGGSSRLYMSFDSTLFGFAPLYAGFGQASTAHQVAQGCIALPFRSQEGMVVTHLGWQNGSAAGSNHDIGIYTTAFVRLVSSGSTLGSGNSLWQWVDVTDTALNPGQIYYLVKSVDATTANRIMAPNIGNTILLDMAGVQTSSADNFPLPDPLVSMGAPATFTVLPYLAIACRAPF